MRILKKILKNTLKYLINNRLYTRQKKSASFIAEVTKNPNLYNSSVFKIYIKLTESCIFGNLWKQTIQKMTQNIFEEYEYLKSAQSVYRK